MRRAQQGDQGHFTYHPVFNLAVSGSRIVPSRGWSAGNRVFAIRC